MDVISKHGLNAQSCVDVSASLEEAEQDVDLLEVKLEKVRFIFYNENRISVSSPVSNCV